MKPDMAPWVLLIFTILMSASIVIGTWVYINVNNALNPKKLKGEM
jgi:hypothetical protein